MAKTVVLLTASWCPRCPLARRLCECLYDRPGFAYRELDVDTPEGQVAANRWGIQGVPALIVEGQVVNEVLDEGSVLLLEVSDDKCQPPACA